MTDPTNDGQNLPPLDGADRSVEIPALEQEIVRLQKERDQFELQLQRTLADTANMRRRQQKEIEDGRRRVIEGMAQELLPALDTFTLALGAYDSATQRGAAEDKALMDGVRMTRILLVGALERHGLTEIPAQGLPFDPLRHEAVSMEPAGEVPEGHVVRVLQTGYQIGDHVVRHSRVVVARPAG